MKKNIKIKKENLNQEVHSKNQTDKGLVKKRDELLMELKEYLQLIKDNID